MNRGLSFSSWDYNTRSNISFSLSKIYFTYLMTPTDFTNDKSTIGRLIWGHIYIKYNTSKFISSTVIQETEMRNFVGRSLRLSEKEYITSLIMTIAKACNIQRINL